MHPTLLAPLLPLLLALVPPAAAQVRLDTKVPLTGWRAIETEHFRIIYPEALEAKAQQAASTLEHVYGPVSQGLGETPRRLQVVLESETCMANGYAQLAPRRSGYYLVPPSDTDAFFGLGSTTSWLDALAVHEFRHVTQFSHGLTGSTWALAALAGESGWTLGTFMSAPFWYFEGDAVTTETVLTSGGRGRNPGFDLMTRALLLEKGPLTYNRAFLGSSRDPYANPYTLGYLLITHGRRTWGADLWEEVAGGAAAWAFVPWTFSWRLHRETGLRLPAFYDAAMADLQTRWMAQLDGLPLTPATPFAPQDAERSWNNDLSPRLLPDGSLVVFHVGYDDTGSLVRLYPDGRRTRLVRVPFKVESTVSVRGWTVAWSEITFDPRWYSRTWSVVKVLDVQTGRVRQVTHRSRLFHPVLSPDGARLAAVEIDRAGDAFLVVLDAATGEERHRVPAPTGEIWHTPEWLADGQRLALVARDDKRGIAPAVVDLETGERHLLHDFAHVNLAHLAPRGDTLFYVSTASGIENVWATDLVSGQRWQVTSRRLAAYTPEISPEGDLLLFADYAWRGARIVQTPLDRATWIPAEQVEDRSLRYFEPLVAQEPADGDILQGIPPTAWESHPYRRALHVVHPHSWQPRLETTGPRVGLSVSSEDITSTTALEAGWLYDTSERTHWGEVTGSLQAFWPILDLSGAAGGRSTTWADPEAPEGETEDAPLPSADWTEADASVGVRLPLDLSRGAWNRSLRVTGITSYKRFFNVHSTIPGDTSIGDLGGFPNTEGVVLPLEVHASFSQSLWTAGRALGPLWGQSLDLSLRRAPWGDFPGGAESAALGLYLPAPGRLQSLHVLAAAERNQPDGYPFDSEIGFPRGFDAVTHDALLRGSVTWRTPLVNVDRGLGPVIFLQRLKGAAFTDLGVGYTGGAQTTYPSAGLQLIGEWCPMRLPFAVDVGAQVAWRFDTQSPAFDLVLADLPF